MTTTEPLPARHCIERAIELHGGSPSTVEQVERRPECYPHTIILARTLEEYGYQPLDPIRKRAREICAEVSRLEGRPMLAEQYLAGDWDDAPMMQATEKALLEPGL